MTVPYGTLTNGLSKERLPGLDGLRGIAIIMVLFAHFHSKDSGAIIFSYLAKIGGYGVEIFFVLSGFLISFLLFREEVKVGNIHLGQFYGRRALRIIPPLFFFLSFLLALSLCGVISIPGIDFLAGLLFFRNYCGHRPQTEHLWTLSIEEHFYFGWPILLVFLKNHSYRIIFLAILLLCLPFWRQYCYSCNISMRRTDLRVEPLLMGALLAALLFSDSTRFFLKSKFLCSATAILAATFFLALASLPISSNSLPIKAVKSSISYFSVALIINSLISGKGGIFSLALNIPPLVWVGKISYSLYLWQQLFAPFPGTEPLWFTKFPINILLSFFLATLSYYCLELPLLRLRKKSFPDSFSQTISVN